MMVIINPLYKVVKSLFINVFFLRSGVYQSEMRCAILDVRKEESESKGYSDVNIYYLTLEVLTYWQYCRVV